MKFFYIVRSDMCLTGTITEGSNLLRSWPTLEHTRELSNVRYLIRDDRKYYTTSYYDVTSKTLYYRHVHH